MVLVPPATWPMTIAVAAHGDARHVVMLGKPVALVAQAFRVLREFERVAQCHGRAGAFGDGGKIENRKWDHQGMLGKLKW